MRFFVVHIFDQTDQNSGIFHNMKRNGWYYLLEWPKIANKSSDHGHYFELHNELNVKQKKDHWYVQEFMWMYVQYRA